MCLSSPNIPAPSPPPQEGKAPEAPGRKKRPTPPTGATILTSPSGIASSALNTGGSTLLGG